MYLSSKCIISVFENSVFRTMYISSEEKNSGLLILWLNGKKGTSDNVFEMYAYTAAVCFVPKLLLNTCMQSFSIFRRVRCLHHRVFRERHPRTLHRRNRGGSDRFGISRYHSDLVLLSTGRRRSCTGKRAEVACRKNLTYVQNLS